MKYWAGNAVIGTRAAYKEMIPMVKAKEIYGYTLNEIDELTKDSTKSEIVRETFYKRLFGKKCLRDLWQLKEISHTNV